MQEVERELKNVETVKYVIARLYLYPSYAYVELGNKLYRLVSEAREVKPGRIPNTVIIDGRTYEAYVEAEAYIDYFSEVEGEEEDVEKALKEECEELIKLFEKDEDKELVAIVENNNSDFYVFALVYLVEED